MHLELDRDDLLCLLKGVEPSLEAAKHLHMENEGEYVGTYGRWKWNDDAFDGLGETQLFHVYKICKRTNK